MKSRHAETGSESKVGGRDRSALRETPAGLSALRGCCGLTTSRWRATRATALAACLFALAGQAPAGPRGAQVVSGDVGIQQNGLQTTITASDGAIIRFQSFDIASNEAVQFVQPGASARVLSRIDSGVPTQIDGQLSANGIVYLVNPAGVMFGAGSVVDVAGLVASSADITDLDFSMGIDRFAAAGGDIENHGSILATNATLLGRHVRNYGSIRADGGIVTLASGDSFLLGEVGGDIMVRVDGRALVGAGAEAGGGSTAPNLSADAGVLNAGDIYADGGRPLLVSGDLYALGVHNVGRILSRGGGTTLAAADGAVVNAGEIDASAPTTGSLGQLSSGWVVVDGPTVVQSGTVRADGGGSVELNGRDGVYLTDGSLTSASGVASQSAGGSIEVASGGRTAVESGARLDASGGFASDGGSILVSGDTLGYAGSARVGAGPGGSVGGLELASSSMIVGEGFAPLPRDAGVLTLDADGSGVSSGDVVAGGALADLGGDLTLSGAESLSVSSPIVVTGSQVTLSSGGAVTLGAPIEGSTGLHVRSGGDFSTPGLADASMEVDGPLTVVSGGGVSLTAPQLIIDEGTSIQALDAIEIDGSRNANGNDLVLRSSGSITLEDDAVLQNADNLWIEADADVFNAVSNPDGTLFVDDPGLVTPANPQNVLFDPGSGPLDLSLLTVQDGAGGVYLQNGSRLGAVGQPIDGSVLIAGSNRQVGGGTEPQDVFSVRIDSDAGFGGQTFQFDGDLNLVAKDTGGGVQQQIVFESDGRTLGSTGGVLFVDGSLLNPLSGALTLTGVAPTLEGEPIGPGITVTGDVLSEEGFAGQGDLTFQSIAVVGGRASARGAIQGDESLTISGGVGTPGASPGDPPEIVPQSVSSDGLLTLGGDIFVGGNVTGESGVVLNGPADIGGDLFAVSGGIDINGVGLTTRVGGQVSTQNEDAGSEFIDSEQFLTLDFVNEEARLAPGDIMSAGPVTLSGASTTGSIISTGSSVTTNGEITVGGNVEALNSVTINDAADITGNVIATNGNVTFDSLDDTTVFNSSVDGSVTAGQNFATEHNTTIGGDVTAALRARFLSPGTGSSVAGTTGITSGTTADPVGVEVRDIFSEQALTVANGGLISGSFIQLNGAGLSTTVGGLIDANGAIATGPNTGLALRSEHSLNLTGGEVQANPIAGESEANILVSIDAAGDVFLINGRAADAIRGSIVATGGVQLGNNPTQDIFRFDGPLFDVGLAPDNTAAQDQYVIAGGTVELNGDVRKVDGDRFTLRSLAPAAGTPLITVAGRLRAYDEDGIDGGPFGRTIVIQTANATDPVLISGILETANDLVIQGSPVINAERMSAGRDLFLGTNAGLSEIVFSRADGNGRQEMQAGRAEGMMAFGSIRLRGSAIKATNGDLVMDASRGTRTEAQSTLMVGPAMVGDPVPSGNLVIEGPSLITQGASSALLDVRLLGNADIAGDIVAGRSVTLGLDTSDAVTFTTAGNQIVDAALNITAPATLTKSTAGDLEFEAGGLASLSNDITVDMLGGDLIVDGSANLGGDLLSANGIINLGSDAATQTITFSGAGKGAGAQTVNAGGGAVTITANGVRASNGAAPADPDGDLTFLSPLTLFRNLEGDGSAEQDSVLTFNQNVTLADSGAAFDDRTIGAGGELVFVGAVTLDYAAADEMTDRLTLNSSLVDIGSLASLNLGGVMPELAVTGTLRSTGAADLTIGDISALLVGGNIESQNSGIDLRTVPSLFVGGDVLANTMAGAGAIQLGDNNADVISLGVDDLGGALDFDGNGAQTIDANGTAVTIVGTLLKRGGDLTLNSPATISVDLDMGDAGGLADGNFVSNGTLGVTGDIGVLGGSFTANQALTLGGNAEANNGFTVNNTFNLTNAALQTVTSSAGPIDINTSLTKAAGPLTLAAGGANTVDVSGTTTVSNGDLVVNSAGVFNQTVSVPMGALSIDGASTFGGDVFVRDTATLGLPGGAVEDTVFSGVGNQELEAANVLAGGSITKTTAGNFLLDSSGNLRGSLLGNGGDLTITGPLAAGGSVTSSGAMNTVAVTANGGDIMSGGAMTLGGTALASGNIIAGSTLNAQQITATAGDIRSAGDMTLNGPASAGADIRSTGGTLMALSTTNAGSDIASGGAMTLTGAAVAGESVTSGASIVAQNSVNAGTDISGGTTVALNGPAVAGQNIRALGGTLTTQQVTATAGEIRSTGLMTLNGAAVAGTDIRSTSGALLAQNTTSAGGDILAAQDVTLNGAAAATGSVRSLGGTLTTQQVTATNGDISSLGLMTLNGPASAGADVRSSEGSINALSTVTAGDAIEALNAGQTVTIAGATNAGGNVAGDAGVTLSDAATIGGNLIATNGPVLLDATGVNSTVTGSILSEGANGTITAAHRVRVDNGDALATGDVAFDDGVDFTTNQMGGRLSSATSDVRLGGESFITNGLNAGRDAILDAQVTSFGGLTIGRDLVSQADLQVAGDTSIGRDATVNGLINSFDGLTTIAGNLTNVPEPAGSPDPRFLDFGEFTTIGGDVEAFGLLNADKALTVDGSVNLTGPMGVGGNLIVDGADGLTVTQGLRLGGDLDTPRASLGSATLVGARDQSLNVASGPLTISGQLVKEAAGDLTLNVPLGAEFGGDVRVQVGSFTSNTPVTFGPGVTRVLTRQAPGESGDQTYAAGANFRGNTVLESEDGTITLNGLTAAEVAPLGDRTSLTIQAPTAVINGLVRAGNLTVNSSLANLNSGAIATTQNQTYAGAVGVGADTELTSTEGGAIAFGGEVTGSNSLTVNTAGATSFGGLVTVGSLITDVAGSGIGGAGTGVTSFARDVTATSGNLILNDPASVSRTAVDGDRAFQLATTSNGSLVVGDGLSAADFDVSMRSGGALALGGTVVGRTLTATGATFLTQTGTTSATSGMILSAGSLVDLDGAVNSFGGVVVDGPQIRLEADLTAGKLAFNGPITLTNDTDGVTTFNDTSGLLEINQPVNGPGGLIATSGGNIVLRENVGASQPVAFLTLLTPQVDPVSGEMFNAITGELILDPQTQLPTVAVNGVTRLELDTIRSAGPVTFNTQARTESPRSATIYAAPDTISQASTSAYTLLIEASEFNMAPGEKLTVLGDLNVNAGSARISDIVTLGTMNITAPSGITLLPRPAGTLLAPTLIEAALADADDGVDYVTGEDFVFSGGVAGSGRFGSVNASGDATGALRRQITQDFGAAVTLDLLLPEAVFDASGALRTDAATQEFLADPARLAVLDLQSDGPTVADVSTSFAGALPDFVAIQEVEGEVALTLTELEALRQLSVEARTVLADQARLNVESGVSLFDDSDARLISPPPVTVDRLLNDRVRGVLRDFETIPQFGSESDEPSGSVTAAVTSIRAFQDELGELWIDYAEQVPEASRSSADFRRYLSESGHERVIVFTEVLNDRVQRIRTLGVTDREFRASRTDILTLGKPRVMDDEIYFGLFDLSAEGLAPGETPIEDLPLTPIDEEAPAPADRVPEAEGLGAPPLAD
ncbi:MAG: filamentous hemagglutinin N-terminal domain-containing protein [Planctomycetota bacterium]